MQNKHVLPAILAGFAAGLVATFFSLVVFSDTKPTPVIQQADASPARTSDEMQAALDEKLSDIQARLTSLEARTNLAATNTREPAEAPTSNELASELQELRDLVASFKSIEKAPPARFQDMVELTIETLEDQERAERDERRRIEREQRMDRQIADLTEKLGLDPNQSTQMRDLLTNRDLERDQFFQAMRDGSGNMDRDTIRTQMRTWSEDYNLKIQGVLSPQQFESYEETNSGRGGWGNWGDRSDRGGRGGGGRGGF